ncbi:hypothetical protein [Belnapia rosea]|uniref:hypothetical protein n=1 Tax=Belnapia rosea TaxID=938405 RepID=UPI00088916E3|nr:hypothetical protein [Belnapia rosea]SDB74590.1 hypothetical protein SAMN02927895_05292 [Belnapia rosea]
MLFPFWDMVFRTGDFRLNVFLRTGDPEATPSLVSGGWWRQQAGGDASLLRRLEWQWPAAPLDLTRAAAILIVEEG